MTPLYRQVFSTRVTFQIFFICLSDCHLPHTDTFSRRATRIMDKKTTTGYITALITIVIWGTTFLSTKILLAGFTPIEIMFFSFLLGLLVLIAVYPKRLRIKDKKQEFTFAAAGLCEICYGRTMSYQF